MQTRICQLVGTGIVRYVGVTYNYSLSAFEKLTLKQQREELLNISQSASTAAKLDGPTTTFYCLMPTSHWSKGRGVIIELLIQVLNLSPEDCKVMDRLVNRLVVDKNLKWGILTTATNEELAGLQLDTAVSICSNQKIPVRLRPMKIPKGNS